MANLIEAENIWQALARASEKPDRRALVFMGRETTYREMDEVTDRVASRLLKLGLQKGDRIGIIGLNQPEWVEMYFAAAKIGAVVVGLNVRYRDSELDYIINQSGARAVFTLSRLGDMDYADFFSGFRERIPGVDTFIFMNGPGFEGSQSYEELRASEVDAPALEAAKAAVRPDDLVMLIYTSGTTGRPKGAAISHESQLASARAQAVHTKVLPEDIMPLALPLNHVGGITCGIVVALLAQATCILIPVFKPDEVIRQIKEFGGTVMPGVPTSHTLLLMNEGIKDLDTGKFRLVCTGGSNAQPDLLRQLYERFPNATVMNLYGLSETSGTVVMSPWDSDFDTTVRSIGKPLGDFRVKVVDGDGQELPVGETGELLFKGGGVVKGYFNMPEETAEGFTDGWVHTGDMGYVDENGYITLMGRKKEMFIQGGFNVYPAEVETLLSRHPKVLMAAGIGVPDPVLGEVGRYYIIPKAGTEPTEEEIVEYCRRHLADYKVPRQVCFRKELPMTTVGKIQTSALKEEYEKTGR